MPTQLKSGNSPEAEFVRTCGCQWVTSAGYMDVVTASGKHLGHFPTRKILDEFRKLPDEDRKPKGGVIPDLPAGAAAVPSPPPGGLVLRVHTRALARDDQGGYRPVAIADYPLIQGDAKKFDQLQDMVQFGPNVDGLWLTEAEWRGLVPAAPTRGQRIDVDPAIAERIARFHLVPHKMVGGGGGWSQRDLRTARLTLIVDDVTPERVRLRADGFAHLGSTFDAAKATTPNGPLPKGYKATLTGRIEFDRKNKEFTRLDLLALGDVWGRWGDANNKSLPVERPGRNPVLVAFELAKGDSPTDRLPPGGWGIYLTTMGYYNPRR